MAMECVKCGMPSGEAILCRECFITDREFVVAPEQVAVMRCSTCGRFSDRGARWYDGPDEAVWSVLRMDVSTPAELEDVKVSVETSILESGSRALVRVTGTYADGRIDAERQVTVKVRAHSCQECSRRAGTYYEAIIQVRGDRDVPPSEIEDALVEVLGLMDEMSVNRVEAVRGGFDVYMIDKEAASTATRELAARHGTRVKESQRHGGFKDGRELFRTTFMVRLTPYHQGSVVEFDGRTYQVLSFVPNARLVDLQDGRQRSVPAKAMEDARLIAKKDAVRETVVVSVDSAGVVVLDPESQRAVTVLTPFDVQPGSTVGVVRHDDRIIILPPEREPGENGAEPLDRQ
ncbi:MAG: 60S ribosomal export protein NMD3 [Thermoplasmata archaeon]|nr:60S ribosomal export protein NMD3 [Thermoplasmata archaeon]